MSCSDGTQPLVYYVFDLLWLDGYSMLNLSLLERKQLLAELIGKESIVHKDDPQTTVPGRIISGDSGNRNRWNKVDSSDYLYYSYFGRNMPDLNFDNPKLREEIFKIGKFWLSDVKVDGFRLDAARHIFPDDRPADNHRWWVYFRNEM